MNIIKLLLSEIKIFSKTNWGIYIIFVLCLVIIYKTNTWNIFEISTVFIFHFLWDLFVMIMIYYFSIKNNKKWLLFQVLNFLVFFSIWIYAWLTAWKWHYLLPNLAFILPSIKGYFLLFKNKNLRFLNWKLSILVNIVIFIINYYLWLFNSLANIIQIIWFSLFSIWLILKKEKYKDIVSMLWIWFITLWSFIAIYKSFLIWDIKWVDISYALLPLTVLVFYIRNFKKNIWHQ